MRMGTVSNFRIWIQVLHNTGTMQHMPCSHNISFFLLFQFANHQKFNKKLEIEIVRINLLFRFGAL